GDAKEAWDNIDFTGFAGVPMQMKINFLCRDSVLAAPLVLDLIRLLDVAKQLGERGIQRQLSMFFKSPYPSPGEEPTHDLFKREKVLVDWVKKHTSNGSVEAVSEPAVGRRANGNTVASHKDVAREVLGELSGLRVAEEDGGAE